MKMIKSRRHTLPRQTEFAVAVAMPIPISRLVHLDPQIFLFGAAARHVIEYEPYPSRQAEFGRNMAIRKFLTYPQWANHTHLFFLDADTWPENEFAIERLLSHNKPFVAGITPIMRKDDVHGWLDYWSAIPLPEPGQEPKPLHLSDELPKGLFKSHITGGTTMLIRRDVLEKLKPPYQQCVYNDDITGYKQSEDYYFTEQIRKAGFDLFVDPDIKCHHSHQFDLLEFYRWIRRHRRADDIDEAALNDLLTIAEHHIGDRDELGDAGRRIYALIEQLKKAS